MIDKHDVSIGYGEKMRFASFPLAETLGGDPEPIKLWTQVIASLEVDDLPAVRVLDAAAWQQRRQRLQELGGPPQQ